MHLRFDMNRNSIASISNGYQEYICHRRTKVIAADCICDMMEIEMKWMKAVEVLVS